ncbi:17235_t:CDS:2, partial [Acaulospora colombiana]
ILNNPEWDDGSLGPLFVRLAWHSSGTYDKHTKTGGSDGATMRYTIEANDPANAGLEHARKFLEPIKEKHNWISYGDLWTLAGVVSIEAMGGPMIPWKPGRKDATDDLNVPPNGRLPDAAQGQQHIREIFYRMGFNDREIVALIGAHCLGRCHGDRSGYEGPWTHTPTQFNNR